jgi:hypothetical protein
MSIECPPILSAGKTVSIAPPLDVLNVPADSVGGKTVSKNWGLSSHNAPPNFLNNR